MGGAIGASLPFAVGLALSPFPIVAMILILGTPRGRLNGPVFAVASILAIAAVGTVVLLLAGDEAAEDDGAPATWVSVLRLGLGAALLVLAASKWRGRAGPDDPGELPRWASGIEGLTAVRTAGLAVLVSGVNPKNLVLTIGGAAAIAQAGIPAGQEAGALAVMVVLGTLGITAPLLMVLVAGDRSRGPLETLRGRMVRHDDAIIAVVALLFGVKLIGDAIGGLWG